MLAWLLIVSLFLFIFFRPSPNAGSARPSVSGRPDVAPSRTKQRLTINTSCLGDDTFSLEELATRFDVHVVETVESHAELWASPHLSVSVVHASTRKGFVSALKQIDPHVHVDKNDAAGAALASSVACRVVLVGRNPGSMASIARGHTTVIDDMHALVSCLGEDGKR
jgi:hypothetical protein